MQGTTIDQVVQKRHPRQLEPGTSLQERIIYRLCREMKHVRIPPKYRPDMSICNPVTLNIGKKYEWDNNRRIIIDGADQERGAPISAYFDNPLADYSLYFETTDAHTAYKLMEALDKERHIYDYDRGKDYYAFLLPNVLDVRDDDNALVTSRTTQGRYLLWKGRVTQHKI